MDLCWVWHLIWSHLLRQVLFEFLNAIFLVTWRCNSAMKSLGPPSSTVLSDHQSRCTHFSWQVEDRYRLPTGPVSLPREPITLYQYEVCPFCCKVKAFLDFHNVRTGMCGP